MSNPEPEKILDLYLIPYAGPWANYGEYLLWKFKSMKLGDVFRLPIFSAFVVKRYAEGLTLENELTGQIWASEVHNHSYTKLLEFIETQRPQIKPSMYERALVRYVAANRLFRQGESSEAIAKALKTSVFRVRAYVAFGNLELVQ
jgi:hypothetical protein